LSFATSACMSQSTKNEFRTHHHDLTSIAAWLGRNSFFVDCDMQALVADAERLLPIPDNDLHRRLLARILSFSLTDKYRPY